METLTNFLIETGSSLLVNPVLLYTWPGSIVRVCIGRRAYVHNNNKYNARRIYVRRGGGMDRDGGRRKGGVATEGGGGMDCIAGNR